MKPIPAINSKLCTHTRSPKSSCERCLKACPFDAVSIRPDIHINKNCIGCGICAAACPNGVFAMCGRNDDSICLEIDNLLAGSRPETITLACKGSAAQKPAEISVACIAGINASVILSAFHQGADRVVLQHYNCPECLLYSSACNADDVFQTMQAFMRLVGIEESRLLLRQVDGDADFRIGRQAETIPLPLNRRGFFKLLKHQTCSRFAALSSELDGEQAENRAPINLKRERLLNILNCFEISMPPDIDCNLLPFAELEITGQCIGCNVCASVCPVGALQSTVKEDIFTLYFKPAVCTQCHLCEEVCIRTSIRKKGGTNLPALLSGDKIKLIALTEKKCLICKQPFYTKSEDTCFICTRSQRKPRLYAQGKRL